MSTVIVRTLRAFAAAVALLSAADPVRAADGPSAEAAYGRRIAERACAACHAIANGSSPNPRAPPFRELHRRYRAGGLDALLTEGQIAPVSPPEEGAARLHPHMPQATLGDDEIAALKAYIHSLEPGRPAHGRRRVRVAAAHA